jgi:DHA1 family bicyclomycin/chloramphenicol resistance-like MFS transporter
MTPASPGRREFVTLVALLISLVALSIDAMLPALAAIGGDLGASGENDRQLVITFLFLGLAVAQLFFGPLSDSIGRRPAIFAGLGFFIAGCLVSALATSFPMMLAGRFLQGFGAAGPRIVTVALVRDGYEGRAMAQIMSLVMMVFILVPALAPGIGQIILIFADWRGIFGVLAALAMIGFAWLAMRQPETLEPARRRAFSLKTILSAFIETCTHRVAFGYTIAGGFIFGAFVGYLNSAQQIYQETYPTGELFAVYFGGIALSIGLASWVNSKLVMTHGMRRISMLALLAKVLVSLVALPAAMAFDGVPPLAPFVAYQVVSFFFIGMLFANFNSLAMEPMGHIAGSASAVIASMMTFMSLLFGGLVGQAYDGTVVPMIAGFVVLGSVCLAVMIWIEKTRTD